jgi:general secretion pathway protein H
MKRSRRATRGFTLIELLVVVTLAALLMGAVIMGMGAVTNSRLKGATTLVSAAIRSAYTRSSATAKPHRVVFDMEAKKVWIEEGSTVMLVPEKDYSLTGGADPATEAEKKALASTDRILKGPPIRKPAFKAVKQAGLEEDEGSQGRSLGRSIKFREIAIAHMAEPTKEGRAYLYIWPGGITERASIQIAKGETPSDDDTMTVLVHPLTGKTRVINGAKPIRLGLAPEDQSEREDRGTFLWSDPVLPRWEPSSGSPSSR